MKKTTLLGALLLLCGIGIGLILKPPAKPAGESVPRQASKSTQRPGAASAPGAPSAADAPGKSPRISGKPWQAPGAEAAALAARERWALPSPEEAHQAALAQVAQAQDRQLESLAKDLALTPGQQGLLRAGYFEPRRLATARAIGGSGRDFQQASLPDLGAVLAGFLTEEQAAAYDQLRADQQRRANESRTLRELAGLSFLDLTAEQRQAAYDVLFHTPSRIPAGGLSMEMVSEGGSARIVSFNTVVMDGERSERVQAVVTAAPGNAEGQAISVTSSPPANPEAAQEAERARELAVDRDASRFQEIFTPEQMEKYRAHLQAGVSPSGTIYPGSIELPPLPE